MDNEDIHTCGGNFADKYNIDEAMEDLISELET
jgi:hypothetical protein